MRRPFPEVLQEIEKLSPDWYESDPAAMPNLNKLIFHVENHLKQPIENSLETGCGRTTLLLSHLSANHTVFAMENDECLPMVRSSDILNKETVTFIEGPTYKTLPNFNFKKEYQVVQIAGSRAYPIPDIEYCFIYPHIAVGGLLLLADTDIPSIRRTYEIVRNDDMFEEINFIDNMAIFRRTSAPTFDAAINGWWEQGYNKPYAMLTESWYKGYHKRRRKPQMETLPFVLTLVRKTPRGLKRMIPFWIKNRMMQWKHQLPGKESEEENDKS